VVETALISFLIGAHLSAPQAAVYRIERSPVGPGAELVTLFEHTPVGAPGIQRPEIPLVTVLRDTLGSDDPAIARLRYVWILTSTRPTLVQRTASALSFLWFRAPGSAHADRLPSPVLDLASPSKTVWSHLAGNGLQALQFDGLGIPIRSSTRSYRGNFSDYRQLQIYRALGALSTAENQPGNDSLWPTGEFIEVFSRLSLADRTFGGLVRKENLTKVYNKETARREEIRGHNWELLRQRAEANGLYFDPLALPDQGPTQAMLWIARRDLEASGEREFDQKFLGIANPWSDARLAHWSGYTETRYFDEENRPVPAGTPGARGVEMIPLALYSLDYPRVPLLLVDFRSSLTAKRRELFGRLSSAVLTGVLGITPFGNLTFFAANSSWTLFQGRHGAPTNRSERLRSYSEARDFLAVDTQLAPELKAELSRRLDHLALNPLENAADRESRVAREQFAALTQWARAPGGLAAKLERDRRKELAGYAHSEPARVLASVGGMFRLSSAESQPGAQAFEAELEARRQAMAHAKYLKDLLASSPRPEIVRDPGEIRLAIAALATDRFADAGAPALIGRLFDRSRNFDIRMACLNSLGRMPREEAKNELKRLAKNPKETDFWRAASLSSLKHGPENIAGAGAGQF
jgi:hypothetical protein